MLTQDDLDQITDVIRRELFRLFVGTVSSCSSGMNAGTGHAGEAFENVLRVLHYGLASLAPSDTEALYADTEAGLANIGERSTSAPSLTSGQVALYDANGAILKLLNASSARRVEIGAGGTYRDAAYSANLQANASAVTAGSAMASWMGQVAGYINTAAPGTVAPAFPGDFGYVSSGSAKVGVEP